MGEWGSWEAFAGLEAAGDESRAEIWKVSQEEIREEEWKESQTDIPEEEHESGCRKEGGQYA